MVRRQTGFGVTRDRHTSHLRDEEGWLEVNGMPGPNILWIVTTQWRASAAGFAGDPNARTPTLDRLAARGVALSQAVTPHPFGPFARAALLTGVESPQNGVRDYFDPLPIHARTVAHDLADRGYETSFFGKWHLARRDPQAALVGDVHARMLVPPEGQGGFNFWEGFESGFLLSDPWLHGTRLPEPVKFPGYQSDVLCERAAEWLTNRRVITGEKQTNNERNGPTSPGEMPRPENQVAESGAARSPWFCLVSLEAPHPPYDAPVPNGLTQWDPAQLILSGNVPRGSEAEAKARRELAGYYAHIEATDRAIGRLLDAVGEEVVVVVTSVHGDMHGAHGLFRKGWPYEESVRVPLLMRGPRKAGDDWRGMMPTAADLVSLTDLRSLAVAWADGFPTARTHSPRAQQISMPSVVALPHQCDRVWRGVRTEKRKLILNEDGSPWLFFDLANDPLELKNLVADPAHRGEIEDLSGLISD